MKTIIFRAKETGVYDGSWQYLIVQLNPEDAAFFQNRYRFFDQLPASDRPSEMIWLGESWGEWVNAGELRTFLEHCGLDPDDFEEQIDNSEEGWTILPESKQFDPNTCFNDEHFGVDCEEVHIEKDGDIFFTCYYKNGDGEGLETRRINVAKLRELFS